MHVGLSYRRNECVCVCVRVFSHAAEAAQTRAPDIRNTKKSVVPPTTV